jgi:hypothetical protein
MNHCDICGGQTDGRTVLVTEWAGLRDVRLVLCSACMNLAGNNEWEELAYRNKEAA